MGGDGNRLDAAELRSALGWWLECGVDIALDEEPRNRLSPARPSAPETEKANEPAAAQDSPPDLLPDSFEALRKWLEGAADLPFANQGGRRILPAGAPDAPVMLFADMPTADAAPGSGPIGGTAWDLTRRMLGAIGIDADDAYVASISCFHGVGRLPPGAERDTCAEIARRQVALARPKRLLLLGGEASRLFLGKPLAAARGHVHKVEGVPTVATFHPSELIQHPLWKELAWSDLLLLMEDR